MGAYNREQHDIAIQNLAKEAERFHKAQVPYRINHGSTNSTRRRDPSIPQLNIAHLKHILYIDYETKTALVEPNVPLDALVQSTLKQGLMPLVVMEFPGITVGGGFSGASGESTCWKEGLFDCSIQEIEMILGTGEIVKAIKGGENYDLFNAARCTLGTMGVVTLLKISLTDAKDSVLVSYHHTSSVSETIDGLAALCDGDKPDFDFIEGILYSKEKGVIITARHESSATITTKALKHQRFDRALDPWFYMHARETQNSDTELVPTSSYLFRHDRGAFWSGEVFLNYYGLPNTRFVRWLLNPIMTARAIYKAMLSVDSADCAIIQDLLLPVESSSAFVDYVAQELNIWPLWICPVRKKLGEGEVVGWPFYKSGKNVSGNQIKHHSTYEISKTKGELMLNFGVWGPTDPEPAAVHRTNRRLEQQLRDFHGMKVPYAANFYTEEEFWNLYDRPKYEEIRRKWHAEALPTIYDKVCRKQVNHVSGESVNQIQRELSWTDTLLRIWPLGGLYQTFHVLFR